MTTNFFTNIAGMGCPGQWSITIQSDENGTFTVSTLFKHISSGDAAAKHIKPFVGTGKAVDFDAQYFDSIEQPLKETAGLLHNMEDYLKGLSKAKEQSKMVQDAKGKNKAKADTKGEGFELADSVNAEAKRRAYTDAIRRVVELDSLCQYAEALAILPTVADYPEKEAEITRRKAELERKKEQKANLLFDI